MAAAGVSAAAFEFASSRLPGAAHNVVSKTAKGVMTTHVAASAGNRVAASMASNIADAATRSLIEGSDFGDNMIAALPNVFATLMRAGAAHPVTHTNFALEAQQARRRDWCASPRGLAPGPRRPHNPPHERRSSLSRWPFQAGFG